MPDLAPPPRMRSRALPAALVIPALRDIPDFDGQGVEAGADVAVIGPAEPIQLHAICGGLISEYSTAA